MAVDCPLLVDSSPSGHGPAESVRLVPKADGDDSGLNVGGASDGRRSSQCLKQSSVC